MSALVCYLSHGRDKFVERAFALLVRSVKPPNRIIVVHNGPATTAHPLFKNHKTIIMGHNAGLVNGTNAAIGSLEGGEHFVRVNDDAMVIKENWLDDLLGWCERLPKVGLLGHSYFDMRHSRPKIFVPHEIRDIQDDYMRVAGVSAPVCFYSNDTIGCVGKLWQPPDWKDGWWPSSVEYGKRVQQADLNIYYVSTGEMRSLPKGRRQASMHWIWHIDQETKHNYDPGFWKRCGPTLKKRLKELDVQ